MKLPGWIKDTLTGIDGVSFDTGRVSWLISTVVIIGAVIGNFVHGLPLSLMDIGAALAANAAAHGVAIKLKENTEPSE